MPPGKHIFVFAIALFLSNSPLFCGPFDKGGVFTVGARSAAMAGASVVSGDDASCLGYNPAGLISADADYEVYDQYAALLANKIVENYFAHRGLLPALDLSYGIGYWNQGFSSQYHYSEQTYMAAFAVPFSDDGRLLFGSTFKFLRSGMDLPDTSAAGYGLDLGFRYRPPGLGEKLGLGLSVLDFQSGLSYPNGKTQNPAQTILAGCAYQFDGDTVLEADGEQINDVQSAGRSSQGFRTGVEHWFLDRSLAARLGYTQSSALAGRFSFGLGARYRDFQLDAAYIQDINQLGDSIRISGGYRFGGAKAKKGAGRGETPRITPRLKVKLRALAEPAVFSPLEGSDNPLTRIRLNVEGETANVASWTVSVMSSAGDTVMSYGGEFLPKEPTVWNGTDARGQKAGEGDYQIFAVLFDQARKELASDRALVKLVLQETQIDLKVDSQVFAPGAMSRRGSVRFSPILRGRANLRSFQFTIRDKNRNIKKNVKGKAKMPASFDWDGKNRGGKISTDGLYYASLEVTFKDASKKTASSQVEIDTRRPKISLQAAPLLFTPKQGNVSISAGVDENSELVSGWEIFIEDLNGVKVASFKGSGLPERNLSWNGVDDHSLAVSPGTLFFIDFAVTTKSGAYATTPRVAVSSEIRKFEEESAIRVPLSTLYFAAGDEVIDLDQYISLKNAADAVKKYGANYLVQVKGYCDDRETSGGVIGPLEISALRAKTVAEYLVKAQGVPEARVAFAGCGINSAPGSNDTEEGRKKSRKVEVILFTK